MKKMIGFLVLWTVAAQSSDLHPKFERLVGDEKFYQKEITEGILHIQQANKMGGKTFRGTHAKGICTKAEFEVLDIGELGYGTELVHKLKQGMFSRPGRYHTIARFANASGKIASDQTPDVRAVSLSINTPRDISNEFERMDFAFNDSNTFPINDSNVFGAIMVFAKYGAWKGVIKVGLSRAKAAKRAADLGKMQEKPASIPFQNMRYWSTVPFLLGESNAVKYALTPCRRNRSQALNANDPDTLFSELERHLTGDVEASCFDFQIQLLDERKMKDASNKLHLANAWIENATWEWNESQAPFHTVARLHLTRNSILNEQECEK